MADAASKEAPRERRVVRRVLSDDFSGVDGDASHRTGAREQRRVMALFIGVFPELGKAPLVRTTTG